MKKLVIPMAVAMFALSFGACSNKSCKSVAPDCVDGRDQVYTGVLPAADADGVRYTLKLDYDDDNGFTDGDYDLVVSYLKSDSTLRSGVRDSISFASKGDFRVVNGKDADASKKYLELKPESRYANADALNFLVESDSTLVLVGPDLSMPVPASGLNYTLKLVK
ncbi:MAG: copper resistance protein NlpE [Clostridium sp.]|nr:copper resistance protein NlpE [Prevotella sp.]MCM1428599.1 copper resistance protein NlpE [Clostridium sp.]